MKVSVVSIVAVPALVGAGAFGLPPHGCSRSFSAWPRRPTPLIMSGMWLGPKGVLLLAALFTCACEPATSRSSTFDSPPPSKADASGDSGSPRPGTTCGGLSIVLQCPDAGATRDAGTCSSPTPFGGLESDGGFPVGCVVGTDNGRYAPDGACVVPAWICQGSPPQWTEITSNL